MNILVIRKYFIFLIIFHLHFVKNELIFVYEHCRHGGRGSIVNNISILYDDSFIDQYKSSWKGNGELTTKGKIQQYIIGISNRYKYPNIINYNNFNPDELLIHVTNTSRAQESAYIQLLAMFNPILKISDIDKLEETISESKKFYYPPNYNAWNYKTDNLYKKIINEAELSIKLLEDININKSESFLTGGKFDLEERNKKNKMNIKYSLFDEKRTFFIIFNCSNHENYMMHNYHNKFIELIKEKIVNKYGNKLQSFFKYENNEKFYDFHNAIVLIDNFMSNYYEGKDLKEFHEETGIDKDEYYKICVKLYEWWIYHFFCDKKTCILESGKLMEDLIDYLENKINNRTSKLNMVIDVGHDYTVGPMQVFMHEAFDVDYSVCLFSCNIYFELHKDIDNNKKEIYFVRYIVDDELRLNINYDSFKKNVLSKIWTEKEKDDFCNGNIYKILYPNVYLIISFLMIAILVGIFVLGLYIFYRKCIKERKRNTLLFDDMNNNLLNKGENKNRNKHNKENEEKGKELEEI